MFELSCEECGKPLCHVTRTTRIGTAIQYGVIPCRECLGRSYDKGLAANNRVMVGSGAVEASEEVNRAG